MCLEWNYWQYVQGGPNKDKYRLVQFMPNQIIDIECNCEMDINFNETGYGCERCGDASCGSEGSSQSASGLRERPFTMF